MWAPSWSFFRTNFFYKHIFGLHWPCGAPSWSYTDHVEPSAVVTVTMWTAPSWSYTDHVEPLAGVTLTMWSPQLELHWPSGLPLAGVTLTMWNPQLELHWPCGALSWSYTDHVEPSAGVTDHVTNDHVEPSAGVTLTMWSPQLELQ